MCILVEIWFHWLKWQFQKNIHRQLVVHLIEIHFCFVCVYLSKSGFIDLKWQFQRNIHRQLCYIWWDKFLFCLCILVEIWFHWLKVTISKEHSQTVGVTLIEIHFCFVCVYLSKSGFIDLKWQFQKNIHRQLVVHLIEIHFCFVCVYLSKSGFIDLKWQFQRNIHRQLVLHLMRYIFVLFVYTCRNLIHWLKVTISKEHSQTVGVTFDWDTFLFVCVSCRNLVSLT